VRHTVVDSCVWISAVLNPAGHPATVLQALRTGRFRSIATQRILDELIDVLSRQRIRRRYGITDRDVREIIDELTAATTFVTIEGQLHLCRDPNDDMIIETAINGRADVIVTRDEDLSRDLELIATVRQFGIEILTVERFLRLLGEDA